MRKSVPVLFGLAGFLIAAGLVALIWAPGVVKKTPLDIDQTTLLDGTVKKLDPATGALDENPVKVQSISKIDSDASTDDNVYGQPGCRSLAISNPNKAIANADSHEYFGKG